MTRWLYLHDGMDYLYDGMDIFVTRDVPGIYLCDWMFNRYLYDMVDLVA